MRSFKNRCGIVGGVLEAFAQVKSEIWLILLAFRDFFCCVGSENPIIFCANAWARSSCIEFFNEN